MNTDSIFFLTGASVQAVPLVNCAPEKSGASARRRGSSLLAPELFLHGDLEGEHGGHQKAAQRQGSLHLRVRTLNYVCGEKVLADLLSLLPFRGFYTEGDLQKFTPCAVQYLFATVCQILDTCVGRIW